MKKTNSTRGEAKVKLIATICMLLIASIMVVSSTYAWVVLSTAPEVTEITTTVGANGALEIKLNIPSDEDDNNSLFRNIVEFENSKYGIDKIVLLPSILADLDDEDNSFIDEFLHIPKYGYDGLVSGTANNMTVVGTLGTNGNDFYQSTKTGVRAVGSISDMTKREADFNVYIAAAKSAMSSAKSSAQNSLKNDRFQSIVIKMVTNASADYVTADVEALGTMITGLETSVTNLEKAYEQLIFASAASEKVENDTVYSLIDDLWGDEDYPDLTLKAIATSGSIVVGEYSVNVDSTVLTGIRALQTTKSNVAAAREAYGKLDRTDDTFTSGEITPILDALVNKDYILVNGSDPASVDFADVMSNGATVTMQDGAGVYVEIADQVGDYRVAISNTVTMETDSDVDNPYLDYSIDAVEDVGAPGGSTADLPMSAHYGYIIDLVFKTNAIGSNLLLQTTPIDRIDNSPEQLNSTEATMGGGSYMEFSITDGAKITNEQVKKIMSCFRIVFFDTDNKTVFGNATLDMSTVTVDANQNVKAYMQIGNVDAVITGLEQNTERNVSVLVYLDAEELENKDVAATTASSITGVMNLQFASDANLQPMPYGTN